MLLLDKALKRILETDSNNVDAGPLTLQAELQKIKDQTMLNVLEDNNPEDTDSIGALCNKLSCVTIQMWHNQELLYKIRHMSAQEFANEYKDCLYDLHDTIKRCCDLNYQRSLIMDAIDKTAVQIAELPK
jgi:hypothetical protein